MVLDRFNQLWKREVIRKEHDNKQNIKFLQSGKSMLIDGAVENNFQKLEQIFHGEAGNNEIRKTVREALGLFHSKAYANQMSFNGLNY